MSKMKYVLDLINSGEYHNLKFELVKAKAQKKSKFNFGETELTIQQAEGMVSIMKSHIKRNNAD